VRLKIKQMTNLAFVVRILCTAKAIKRLQRRETSDIPLLLWSKQDVAAGI